MAELTVDDRDGGGPAPAPADLPVPDAAGGGAPGPADVPVPDDEPIVGDYPFWPDTPVSNDPLDMIVGRRVRVLLVDDDPLVRAGLSLMLGAFEEIEVVGSVGDGSEVVGAVNSARPDVVLMDIRMPGMDGLTATEAIRRRRNPPEVIVLTTFDTDEHVRRAIRVGASGFLLKHTRPADIARAVCRAAMGEPIFTPSVLRQVMGFVTAADENPGRSRARAALGRLSPSERDVAQHIADGQTNQEIAADLMMSVATVKAYVTRIFAKLSVSNRVQIAMVVLESR